MVTVVEYLSAAVKGKPIDGSDVKTLEEARAELTRLRRVAYRVCDILNKTTVQPQAPDERTTTARPARKPKSEKKKHRQALAEEDSYKDYNKVFVEKSDDVRRLLKTAMHKNLLFKGYSDGDLDDFADVFAPKKFLSGSTVIKQGDQGGTFYIVESGALDIFINIGEGADRTETQVGVPYGPGGGFGELALIYNCPRAATIRTSEECVLWEITRTAFKGLQLQHNQKAHKLKLSSLANVKIGQKRMGEVLSAGDLESMALAVKTQSFSAGEAIVREGEKGDVFYVITKGTVIVSKQRKKLASLGVNSFFGEKALLSSDTRNATCEAETDVECLTLLRDDFVLLLGNMEDLLSGKKKLLSQASSLHVISEATTYAMDDLMKGGVLGEGAFGKVNVVKSKKDGRLFALKAQGKAFLVENGQEQHTVGEYQLLREINHVFVVKIYQALQDQKYVYFLMNLLPGGELMDLLDSMQNFPENWTRFYGATVLSAFQSIHKRKIAYRDLKPENLVLDADGYCYVIDFGLAKKCDKGKTWTFCGTPDYLAPEIIRGKGHDWGVDYWGLGIFLYEITHGYPPFYAADPTNTARKIIRGTFSTPPKFSESLSDLIHKLLCEQSKRLGRTQGGAAEIIKHQWFSGFDWDGLLGKTMKVPSKPKVGNLEKLGKRDHQTASVPDSSWNPVF
mmetsp:Transcript_37602/g.80214  ORF Transcript_37602/g.80214 Transcript_37602/m.80214 type:complete len:678 (+) Transcript_37602:178-2211(+)|eukprot:CAMPEP_0172532708 /NCGR_PEP_ID=MMETSP1067-20121228/5655_1 /TAXON_ID=265564 ORGANISM="Thalassiosira punctigera, Strain Tpunct2005C2" /NCGR_SAMPLE_ID=MMETSP1067 /ASSEMBLY_ACC=CAM_ASM_000444 /LENGTH=677 /DNA_ID=CAMNT_0013317257 /DNA_START=178 /DNA_END=2211 /DNA_ORIENTATION=+